MTLTVDKGWVTEASVEDVKLLPGVHRTMFRLAGRRMGGARDREGRPVRARQIRGQQRRRRLVGQSGPHGQRQPVLEARERHDVEAAAAAGQRDARGRAGGPVVHGRGQSRGVGRSQDRGRADRRAVSEEARRHAGEPHLQIRLQRRPLHLSVERQVRLPVALAVGRRSAEICRADEADAAVAGRGQGQGHPQGLHHLPLPGVRPVGPGPHPRPRQSAQGDRVLRQGHGGGRVQRARPHHRDVRSRRREIPDAGRWRRGTGPDPPGPDEHQGARGLSAGSLLEGRSRPRRSTTTSWWTSNPARRRSSPSIASGRGRPSRSGPWSCSSEQARMRVAGARSWRPHS